MRPLLDTPVALWAIADHPNLSDMARHLIEDPDNQIVISVATICEISVNYAPGRSGPNDMPISGQTALTYFREAGYELLDITPPTPRRWRRCRRCTMTRPTACWWRRP